MRRRQRVAAETLRRARAENPGALHLRDHVARNMRHLIEFVPATLDLADQRVERDRTCVLRIRHPRDRSREVRRRTSKDCSSEGFA